MIRYELLRILRSRKWQYLVPLALLLYIYCSGIQYYNVTVGDNSARLQELQIQAAAVLASFLFLSILYLIAWEGEPPLSWRTFLAYPLTCSKDFLAKLAVLLLFQIPAAALGIGVYILLRKTYSSLILPFLLCMQLLYLTGFLYGCYKTSQGYLSAMGTVTIVNVIKRLVPVFLIFCILNARDWSPAFASLWPLILLFCMSVIIGLFLCLPVCMKRKLHREMVLSRLFPNLTFTPGQLMLMRYQKLADRFLQFVFCHFDTHRDTYWKRCAVIEVSIKLHAFSFAFFPFFLLWFLIKLELLLLIAAIVCLLHMLYCLRLESRTIQAVYCKGSCTMQGTKKKR